MGPLLPAAECHHTVAAAFKPIRRLPLIDVFTVDQNVYGGSECAIKLNIPSLL